jgi:N-acetylglutamate synthase-like GNAT family acetyltransferase
MSPPVAIRQATSSDAPALAPLLGELGYPVGAESLAYRMDRLKARDDQFVLIAEDEIGAVGVLALHVFPLLAYDRDVGMIMALVVTERARGTGTGRQLIERAQVIAKAAGAGRLIVNTHVRRGDAHAFYERLGFEFTGRRYVRTIT